jgi:hypothetical protein
MQKLSGRLRVSSENYYLPLPPGPLDTKSVISRPVPIVVLLSGGPLSTAGSQHSNPGLTAAPQLSCRLGVNFKLNHCGLMLNRLDGSGSASTTRLYQVGSTSPAWAASKTQAGPCHFRRRVKSANSLRLGLGVGEPATLRLQTDSDVTGSGMPPAPSPPPPPFICKNMGKHPVISELPPSPCQYMYVYCMYMHIYTIICMYTAVYICICMYMYVYVCIIAKWTVKCLSTKNSICKYIRVYVCICM